MKNKKIFVIVSLIFLFGIVFNTTVRSISVKGKTIEEDDYIATVADKDSYVSTSNPTSNYGGKDWLIFGEYITGWDEAYLYFSFEDEPDDYESVEISIDMYSVSETFQVTVSLVTESWDETTITWINKPNSTDIIETFTVSEGKIYKIDISDYIEGEGISIRINASNYLQTGYVQAHSSEGYYSDEDAPQIIWTFDDSDDDDDDDDEKISDILKDILGFDLLITLVSMIGIGVLLVKKNKK